MTETIGLVQQFVERAGQLYSLPAVAAEVLRITSEPRIDARALKECLERDPALATRLLRVVNSSLFGLSRQVTDLGQALALIGIRPLKMLVLGFSLPKELFSGLEADVLSHYWRRTLIKAIAARELAERQFHVAGDEAFIAGLVQDIGVLALIQQLGPSYQKFLVQVRQLGGNLLDRELETLGFDHMVLSSRLLQHWGLPTGLCAAVATPPDETRIAALDDCERRLPQILHLADLLARLIEQPYGSALHDLLGSGGRYCDLSYEKVQEIMAALQPKVEELAKVLALELPEEKSYVDLLIAAQRGMADEALAAQYLAPAAEDELLRLTGQIKSEMAGILGHGGARQAAPPAKVRINPAEQRLESRDGGQRSRERPRGALVIADASLASRVGSAIQRCRLARKPISLALFEIERFGDLLLELGPDELSELTHWLREALSDWSGQRAYAAFVSDSCFAIVWEDCPRSEGIRVSRQALAEIKRSSRHRMAGLTELALSAGLATLESPPKNFPAQELIDAAQRCLGAAQLSGGDTVKSIAF
jgi:HD-like signal output (HDOD) protein/GGDEF domain-containing protein